jgi:hypothetical protein
MKITSVELHPAGSSAVCELSFRDPQALKPYNVRTIVGLDAQDIIPRYYAGSGSLAFYNFVLEKRDVVFRISLNPNASLGQSFSSLRDDIYKLISSSRTGSVEIRFLNGTTVIATVSGFVQKLEAALFEKQPEVQLTVSCSDPMLRAPDPTIVDVSGLDPSDTTISDILSTAPHGLQFEMEFLADLASFTMEDPNDASWSFVVTPSGGFLTGYILHFSSETNDKFLYVVRGVDTIYLADAIDTGSVWPIIFPGDNHLSVADPTSLQWNAISYHPTYWGV